MLWPRTEAVGVADAVIEAPIVTFRIQWHFQHSVASSIVRRFSSCAARPGSCYKDGYHSKRWPDVLCCLGETVIEETATWIVITGRPEERTTMSTKYHAMDAEG